MSKRSYRPQRTCLGCGAKDDRSKLIRLVLGSQGELKMDPSAGGRGGYLHGTRNCWQAFLKKKSQHRAFRVEIGRAAKEKLIKELSERQSE